MAADPFGLVGRVLDSQFRVSSLAGEGECSVVYRATDPNGRNVALKCLRIAPRDAPALRERFTDACQSLSALASQPSVCQLIGNGVANFSSGKPIFYMAFEWLEGISLETDFTNRRRSRVAPRTWGEIKELFAPAADALAAAHAHSIVHCDLKPRNFFLAHGGPMKVLDFAVAAIVREDSTGDDPTRVIAVAPRYAAPELFDRGSGVLGPWTDVYSFALVLLEAAMGSPVRKGETYAEIAMDLLKKRVPSPRAIGMSVPDTLEDLFAAALAFDPSRRPHDMHTFMQRFRYALGVEDSITASAPSPSGMPDSVQDFLGAVRSIPTPTRAFDDERTVALPPAPQTSPDASSIAVTDSAIMTVQEDRLDHTVKLADASAKKDLQITEKGGTLPLAQQAPVALPPHPHPLHPVQPLQPQMPPPALSRTMPSQRKDGRTMLWFAIVVLAIGVVGSGAAVVLLLLERR